MSPAAPPFLRIAGPPIFQSDISGTADTLIWLLLASEPVWLLPASEPACVLAQDVRYWSEFRRLGTAEDMAWSPQRVVLLDKAPASIDPPLAVGATVFTGG